MKENEAPREYCSVNRLIIDDVLDNQGESNVIMKNR